MRTKKEVYKKEQDEIIYKIISIVGIEDNTQITLYELDNDIKKQKEIMDLIPDIRKYFSFNNLKAVGEPKRIKRPWLSIIKQLTKEKYTLHKKDYRIYQDDRCIIRTILYTFSKN
jgi:hypothetical protein